MANDVKAMTEEEIRKLGEHYCNKNGFDLLEIKELENKADFYLRYVMAHNEKKQEYATWLLNVEMGGLHYGHYFGYYLGANKEEAFQDAFDYFQNY